MMLRVLLFFLCLIFFGNVQAQSSAIDTTSTVYILSGTQSLIYKRIDAETEVHILAGNVRLRQGTTLFSCDSCVINEKAKVFEAFGNVHINDSDTAHVYANYLRYLTDKRLAYLKGKVRLTDGHGTLTTHDLEYDVSTKIGTYKNGGRVESKKTVLTSKEGVYYTDLKDVYFKKAVELKNPDY